MSQENKEAPPPTNVVVSSNNDVELEKMSKHNDYTIKRCGKHVTVYGWSRTQPDTPRWLDAEGLGKALGEHGYGVVTGGYNGSMAAVSKGAALAKPKKEATPAKPVQALETCQGMNFNKARQDTAKDEVAVRGILVPGQFPDRALVGNQYLNETFDATNIVHRIDVLTGLTRYYVALPGTLGTLTEIAMIWCIATILPEDVPKPIIILWRDPWEALIKSCGEMLSLPTSQMACIKFVNSVEECVSVILADYEEQEKASATTSATATKA